MLPEPTISTGPSWNRNHFLGQYVRTVTDPTATHTYVLPGTYTAEAFPIVIPAYGVSIEGYGLGAGPLPVVMGVMLYTGLKHHRRVHLSLSVLFFILWAGTFITGVFFLPR